jgi:ferredoxin-nitrite reductase
MLDMLKEVSQKRNQKINKLEKIKPNRTIKEAMDKLREYATTGYDSIEKDDKAVFFKYFGIFDKEKSNGANHFMLRVWIPAGRLSVIQARKVGEVAKLYGNDYIDITTRMQIELLINKMIDSTSSRAEVFSELLVDLNQF